MFGIHSGSVEGLFRVRSGSVRGPFGVRSGSVRGPFRIRSESVWEFSLRRSGYFFDKNFVNNIFLKTT